MPVQPDAKGTVQWGQQFKRLKKKLTLKYDNIIYEPQTGDYEYENFTARFSRLQLYQLISMMPFFFF